MAQEFAPLGIRVNAICPGVVGTAMWLDHLMANQSAAAFDDRMADMMPLGRPQTADDMGQAAVYLATALEDAAGVKEGEKVAVKIVHPHLLERRGFFKRFMREAEIGKSVRHESVVRTYDVDAEIAGGKMVHYMVMEYVEGRTLRELLQDLKTVPETLLREVARQVASGLACIHAAGIVHRDLKPENVFLVPDEDGTVTPKLLDFGIAKLAPEGGQTHKTKTGTAMG